MEYIVIILAIIIALAGILGCLLPVLPGPTLGLLSLLGIHFLTPIDIDHNLLWILTALTLLVSGLDYILPVWGAKAAKAGRYGIWGSIAGMIAGLLLFPPFGVIIGAFAGAVIGEIYAGKQNKEALKAGLYTFLATLLVMVLKLSLTFWFVWLVITESISFAFG